MVCSSWSLVAAPCHQKPKAVWLLGARASANTTPSLTLGARPSANTATAGVCKQTLQKYLVLVSRGPRNNTKNKVPGFRETTKNYTSSARRGSRERRPAPKPPLFIKTSSNTTCSRPLVLQQFQNVIPSEVCAVQCSQNGEGPHGGGPSGRSLFKVLAAVPTRYIPR